MPKKEAVQPLSSEEFQNFISDKKAKLVIVDFFAEWCMPCVMMAPVLEKFAQKNPTIKFGKINVDDAGELSNRFEVSSIPCVIFFKDGEEVDRVVGSVSDFVLNEKIRDYL